MEEKYTISEIVEIEKAMEEGLKREETLRNRKRMTKKTLLLALALAGISNVGSLLTVAMEKYISRYSNEQAALVNHLSTDFINETGFNVGHQLFYGDKNYRETARNQIY